MLKKICSPQIRFKQFDSAWLTKKVGDLFLINRSGNLTKKYFRPFVSAKYIYPVYSSQIENHGILGYYKDFLAENVITWTADGVNAGVVNFRKEKFFATSGCGILISKKYQPNEFFAIAIGNNTRDHITPGPIPHLISSEMAQVELKFTPNINEQKKISQLFEALENLANKLEEKISVLKNLKNDFNNKMFANLSSDFPSIRFKGFKSAWITDQVKNLFEISRGQTLTKHQIKTRPVERERERESGYIYPVYSSQIKNHGIFGYYNEYLAQKKIIFSTHGNPGSAKFIQEKFFATSNCGILSSKKYPESTLFAIQFEKNSKKFISQGTIPHLISSNVLKIELKFTPDVAEQQKISQLFETFDSLIFAYEQKVEYLKNLKNSFIAKMFI
ncbi:restriction endonuclease subunit S [Mesomycoplasma ovipneumoniae]|uniref:restriction endonuclease subunit S n=1 Tax=Mesomycoplasma ovipneumoniae TaxID=29562 RepID=UPI0029645279|nr:restriction endonuclease subunit S [Mesomycoplasma ovipneumoniae]MDW2930237.1 restriction endonuclease subunit S [Mesomycoplasma ovipneumoniae]